MDNNQKLLNIFSEIFEVDKTSLNESSSQDSIEKWDSMGMVQLINELELQFDVQFDLPEVAEFLTIGIVKSTLIEKGVQF